MAGFKLVVLNPTPKDIETFEKVYQEEHVPMAVRKLEGKTKIVATKVVATPDGTLPPNRRDTFSLPSSAQKLRNFRGSSEARETDAVSKQSTRRQGGWAD